MSRYGWNSTFTNSRGDHSRPYGSRSSMLACRICDKMFLSTHSLIEHYESHENEFAQQIQAHRSNIWSFQRNLNPFRQHQRLSPSSSALPQRYHPYFPNSYRNQVANINSSFPIPTQNSQLYQPRTQSTTLPVRNNSTFHVPSLSPISMTGRSSDAGTSQFAVNQPVHVPKLQLGPSMNSMYATQSPLVSDQRATPSKIEYQKGYDDSGDKKTKWYLGQMEQPIPEIIDLWVHKRIWKQGEERGAIGKQFFRSRIWKGSWRKLSLLQAKLVSPRTPSPSLSPPPSPFLTKSEDKEQYFRLMTEPVKCMFCINDIQQ